MIERSFGGDEIRCDICNKYSNYNANIGPWDKITQRQEWLCEDCRKAVKDATKQKIYPTITLPNKIAEEKYNKEMETIGFHYISSGPSINIEEVKERRFEKK